MAGRIDRVSVSLGARGRTPQPTAARALARQGRDSRVGRRDAPRARRARAPRFRGGAGAGADVHVGVVADWWVLGKRRVVSWTTGFRRGSRRRYRRGALPGLRGITLCVLGQALPRERAGHAAAGRVRRGPTPDREHDRRETSGGDPRARSVGSRVPVVVRGAARQVPANAPERSGGPQRRVRGARGPGRVTVLSREPRDAGGCLGRREDAQAKAGSVSVPRRARRGDENVGLPQAREPRGRGDDDARDRESRDGRVRGGLHRDVPGGERARGALAGADDARRGGRRKKRRNKLLPPRAVAGGRSAPHGKVQRLQMAHEGTDFTTRTRARVSPTRPRADRPSASTDGVVRIGFFVFFVFFKPARRSLGSTWR